MLTRQPKVLLTTDCCSDMYGLLDWACSESLLVAILVVVGAVVVWNLFFEGNTPDDHGGVQEESQKLNLSLNASQRQRDANNKPLDDVRWSVSVKEINVKLSVDHTLEQTRAETHSDFSECAGSNTTALSATTSFDVELRGREDGAREPSTRPVTCVLVKGMDQLCDERRDSIPYQSGSDAMSSSDDCSEDSHVRSHCEWCNRETMTANLGGDHDPIEVSEQCPVKCSSTGCSDALSMPEVSNSDPALNVIQSAICEAGDLELVPTASITDASTPSDQHVAGGASGKLDAGDITTESSEGEWVIV